MKLNTDTLDLQRAILAHAHEIGKTVVTKDEAYAVNTAYLAGQINGMVKTCDLLADIERLSSLIGTEADA